MVPFVTAPSSDPTTTRGLLRTHRDLRLLLAAGLVTMTGDWMLSVGLVYTVYDVTGSLFAWLCMAGLAGIYGWSRYHRARERA